LGRWISRDPIEEDGGVNLYAHALNDPVNLVDPSGQIAIADDLAIAALVGAFLSAAVAIKYLQDHPNLSQELQQAIRDLILQMQEGELGPAPTEAELENLSNQQFNDRCNKRQADCSAMCGSVLGGAGSSCRWNECMRDCMGACGWPRKVRYPK
jgi:uncharacterized protein RhaS with RHS repeats